MKIANYQRVMSFSFRFIGALIMSFIVFTPAYLSQGESLFKAKCATCHQIHTSGTYPKLFNVRQKWDEAGEGDLIYEWVKNNAALRASGKSKRAAEEFSEYNGTNMTLYND